MSIIRIRKGGEFTLPVEFRKKYNVKVGDTFTVVELNGGLLIRPIRDLSMEKSTEPVQKEIKIEEKAK